MSYLYNVAFTLLDANGVKATTSYYLLDETENEPIATVMNHATMVATVLDGITDGQIIDLKVMLAMPNIDPTPPEPTADVSDTGTLNFDQEDSRYPFPFLIPALSPSVIVDGKIDITAGNLPYLIQILTNSFVVTFPVTVVSTAQEALTELRDTFRSTRKHRHQLEKMSKTYPT